MIRKSIVGPKLRQQLLRFFSTSNLLQNILKIIANWMSKLQIGKAITVRSLKLYSQTSMRFLKFSFFKCFVSRCITNLGKRIHEIVMNMYLLKMTKVAIRCKASKTISKQTTLSQLVILDISSAFFQSAIYLFCLSIRSFSAFLSNSIARYAQFDFLSDILINISGSKYL